MEQPFIDAGAGLRLRPLAVPDAETVLRAYGDPLIRHFHGRSLESVAEAEDLVRHSHGGWSDEKHANWVVERTDGTAAIVGRVGLSFIDLERGIAEISYWVLPEARGGGVAVAAASALADWSLDVLGIHRLEIMHSTTNPASCAVASKAGFEAEGTLRSYQLHGDGWHDMHLHSRIRPD